MPPRPTAPPALRTALSTREPETVFRVIRALHLLAAVPGAEPASGKTVGQLLVPFYRHLLPVFNLFKSRGSLASASDDYSTSIGEAMDECAQADTLDQGTPATFLTSGGGRSGRRCMDAMAASGGPGAAAEINRLVPLWCPTPGTLR